MRINVFEIFAIAQFNAGAKRIFKSKFFASQIPKTTEILTEPEAKRQKTDTTHSTNFEEAGAYNKFGCALQYMTKERNKNATTGVTRNMGDKS